VSPFLQQLTLKMLSPSKRHIVTCTTLLAEIEEHAPERPPSSLGTAGSLGTLSHSPMKFAHGSPTTPLNLPARRRRPSSPSASPRDYFMSPGLASSQGAPRHSRIKEEWEQLEPLGRGGFGRVFKARLLLDGGVYAVKKVELKPDRRRNDAKIFREVNALAKLNHRFIVRYYTTWIEEDDADSALASEDSSESGDDMTAAGRPAGRGMWRVPSQRDGNSEEDLFRLDFSDPGSGSMSRSISGNSFPSVVFEHSGGGQDGFFSEEGGEESDDDEDEDEDETGEGEDSVVFAIDLDKDLVDGGSTPALSPSFFSPKPPKRFLYIQMVCSMVQRRSSSHCLPGVRRAADSQGGW
jgi:translation initiation factor 2-alpha kinase 4